MLWSIPPPVARWILVTRPEVFSNLTWPWRNAPRPNSDPICRGLLTVVTHVHASSHLEASPTSSSLTIYPPTPSYVVLSVIFITYLQSLFRFSKCFRPRASLSKVVSVLSFYLILFYSPWLRPNFFKTYGWYHSSQHIMIRVMVFWFWLFSFVWLPHTKLEDTDSFNH